VASKSKSDRPQLATAHGYSGVPLGSEAQLTRALALDPTCATSNYQFAVLLRRRGAPLQVALEHFRRAWIQAPEHTACTHEFLEALVTGGFFAKAAVLAMHARKVGHVQPRLSALTSRHAQALSAVPADEIAQEHIRFAQRFMDAKQDEAAMTHLCAALRLRPSSKAAFARLYLLYREHGKLVEAASICCDVLRYHPELADAHIALGSTLTALGRHAEARAHYRILAEQQPENLNARSARLFDNNFLADATPENQYNEAVAFGALITSGTPQPKNSVCDGARTVSAERLRVGLVSGDMRDHPVAQFLLSVLQQSVGGSIDWYVYSTVNFEDTTTQTLRQMTTLWQSIHAVSDGDACALIRQNHIDVLIDLSGHTAGNRLGVFALRSAPVQVSWLGYFATTGLPTMDYLLADKIGIPSADQKYFSESIIYLPESRLCFTAPEIAPSVATPPLLASQQVTYGTFQNAGKITDEVLQVWSQILNAVAGSQLRMQSLAWGSENTTNDMVKRLKNAGIAPNQVSFFGNEDKQRYLSRYAEVDIILDTFPYPGGTTTCEALWMGVPTVTLKGGSLLARQGASLLSAAGLSDWIAASPTEYVSMAMARASEPQRLAELRNSLRQRVKLSPLMDAQRFFKALESTLLSLGKR
jgi:protein O-GlcNAc transferase